MARGPFKAAAMKEPAAWIAACVECHRERLAAMRIERQLAYKAIGDLPNYDRVAVNLLRRRQPNAVDEREVLAEVIEILRREMR